MQVLESPLFAGSPGVAQPVRWVGTSSVQTLVVSTPSYPARYNSLSLEVVGTVSTRDFCMYPHGNWSPLLHHPFSEHVGMFSLEGNGCQLVAMTWDSVLANIKTLQGGSTGDVLCLPDKLVLTHCLFWVRYRPLSFISTPTYIASDLLRQSQLHIGSSLSYA